MSDKQIFILSDKSTIPSDELIFSIIGDKCGMWKKMVDFATENSKDVTGSWNYYNDGKQWLFKLGQKKKTIFWAALMHDGFRITFWFGDKAEPLIESADLPDSIKQEFRSAKKIGLIRPLSIFVSDNQDLEHVFTLISVKQKIK
jgi:hypothetical protein